MATMQRNENIRKLFATKKNFTKSSSQDVMTSRMENATCPRSISYTNLENATNNKKTNNNYNSNNNYNNNDDDDEDKDEEYDDDDQNETRAYNSSRGNGSSRLKGPWALSQSNGQIASQHLQDVIQNDVFDYGSNREFNGSRRNSSANATPTIKIKRWHVSSYKGNDVTKETKLAKSLLGPNQLATFEKTSTPTKPTPSYSSSSADLTIQQHNQFVAGYSSSLHTSFPQLPLNANVDGGDDYYDVQRPEMKKNCIVASTPRLNSNYYGTLCPPATLTPMPPQSPARIRRPSAQWFKRKNWLSQDDNDDIVELASPNNTDDDVIVAATTITTSMAGGISVNDCLHHWESDQLQMNFPGDKEINVKPTYNCGITATTNKNVNNYCWPNGSQMENYIPTNRHQSITDSNNNLLHKNAILNEFSASNNNSAITDGNHDASLNYNLSYVSHKNNTIDLESNKKDNQNHNKNVILRNKMPLGQSLKKRQENNENSKQQPQFPLKSIEDCQHNETPSLTHVPALDCSAEINLKASQTQDEKANQPHTLGKYSMSSMTTNSNNKGIASDYERISRQISKYNTKRRRTSSLSTLEALKPTISFDYKTTTPMHLSHINHVTNDDRNDNADYNVYDDDVDDVDNAGVGFLQHSKQQQPNYLSMSTCNAVLPVNEYKQNNKYNNNTDQRPSFNPR